MAVELAMSEIETLDTLEDAQKFEAKRQAKLLKNESRRVQKY
jgi:hypothetical protein